MTKGKKIFIGCLSIVLLGLIFLTWVDKRYNEIIYGTDVVNVD